jgi:sugar lactone lactonase YvrE
MVPRVLLLMLVGCQPPPDVPEADERDPCVGAPGTICTWLGVPQTAMFSAEGLHRLDATIYSPVDGLWGPDGRFYAIDFNSHRIRVVDPQTDLVSTVAGSGFLGDGPEGPALEYTFNHPAGLAFDPADDHQLVVAAWANNRVVRVALDTRIGSYAYGTGLPGFSSDGGPASEASFDHVSSVAFEPDGTMYLTDQRNQLIRRVDPSGTLSTLVGRVETRVLDYDGDPDTPGHEVTRGWEGYAGDGGPAAEAQVYSDQGTYGHISHRVAIHERSLFFVDTGNHLVRKVDLDSGQIDRVAGRVETREQDRDGDRATPPDLVTRGWPGFEGEGTSALDVFNRPTDIEVGVDGTLFIADRDNHCVRRIDPDGIVTTVAGICGVTEAGFSGDGGPATEARLWQPFGIALAPDGRLFIADTNNQVFRVVYP